MTTLLWGGHDPAIVAETEPTTIEWDGTRRVRVRLLEAKRAHKPLVVFGPRGSGKTFSVARACEHVLAGEPDCGIAYLRIPAADRGRGLYRSALQQITAGKTVPPGATETQLLWDLTQLLSEQERIVVVDEAHRISTRAQDAIQNLVDAANSKATWVLLGGPDTPTKLLPELWSRASAKVEFRRLADDEVAAVLSAMHPLFAATDPALLQSMNRMSARGELRYWISILARALRYRQVIGDSITSEHVRLLTEDL